MYYDILVMAEDRCIRVAASYPSFREAATAAGKLLNWYASGGATHFGIRLRVRDDISTVFVR